MTLFGVATYEGVYWCSNPGGDCTGWPTPTPFVGPAPQVFSVNTGEVALVVEARHGGNGNGVPTSPGVQCGSGRPYLQIESTNPLGTSPTPVCAANDTTTAGTGSIPAIPTPNFGSDPAITAALQGFAAEFVACLPGSGCIFTPNGDLGGFITVADVQFFDKVNYAQAFPQGDTLLTVQVVDANFTPGPTAQIVVRVATWTPAPTPTP